MAYKDPLDERARAARRKHYHANKQQYLDRARLNEERIRAYIAEVKAVPCMDCGVQYPSYVMDFDHRDPAQKLMSVSGLAKFGSLASVMTEIDKCDIVCSNCHRERTHGKPSPCFDSFSVR